MKAIVYEGPEKIAVKDVPMPKVPEGYALVKICCAGICGTDLNIYKGTHPRAKAPLIQGHEFSGILQQDTKTLKKGTRVTAYPLISCGECEACKSGNAHVCNTLRLLGIDCDGGFAEYVAVPEDKLYKIDDNVTDEIGAFIEPIAVTVHALRETGYVPGDNAIVIGGGGIGLATCVTLKQFGCQDLVLAENDEARIKVAKSLGINVINSAKVDLHTFGKEHCKAGGFDWVYDCAGVQPVADCLLDLVKVRGHITIIASYKKSPSLPLFMGMAKETDIRFCRVYRPRDYEIAAQLASVPDYRKIITHVLTPDEAQKGYDLLFTKGSGAIKVMYKFGGNK